MNASEQPETDQQVTEKAAKFKVMAKYNVRYGDRNVIGRISGIYHDAMTNRDTMVLRILPKCAPVVLEIIPDPFGQVESVKDNVQDIEFDAGDLA